MDKFLCGFLFVLSAILAVVFLNQLQGLPMPVNGEVPSHYWTLVVFGYGSAAMTFVSGVGLVMLVRE